MAVKHVYTCDTCGFASKQNAPLANGFKYFCLKCQGTTFTYHTE
jgi:hypothetical protein